MIPYPLVAPVYCMKRIRKFLFAYVNMVMSKCDYAKKDFFLLKDIRFCVVHKSYGIVEQVDTDCLFVIGYLLTIM